MPEVSLNVALKRPFGAVGEGLLWSQNGADLAVIFLPKGHPEIPKGQHY
jgi:hypothetical protein